MEWISSASGSLVRICGFGHRFDCHLGQSFLPACEGLGKEFPGRARALREAGQGRQAMVVGISRPEHLEI